MASASSFRVTLQPSGHSFSTDGSDTLLQAALQRLRPAGSQARQAALRAARIAKRVWWLLDLDAEYERERGDSGIVERGPGFSLSLPLFRQGQDTRLEAQALDRDEILGRARETRHVGTARVLRRRKAGLRTRVDRGRRRIRRVRQLEFHARVLGARVGMPRPGLGREPRHRSTDGVRGSGNFVTALHDEA